MRAPSKKRPGRVRRALRVGLKVIIGFVAAAAVLAVAAVALVANTAAGRRLLVGQINGALGPSFKGRVAVDGLESLGLSGLSGVNLTVADKGGQLLRVRNVGVTIDPVALVKGALFDKTETRIAIGRVTVDEVFADVSADGAGALRLAGAFESTSPPSPEKPSKPFRLIVGSARVEKIIVRGEPSPSFRADVDASGLDASLEIAGAAGKAELRALHVVARQLPRAGQAEGDLSGAASWGEGEPEGRGSFRGSVGGLALSAEGRSERSGALALRAEVPSADAERWRAVAPEMPLVGKLGVRIKAEGPRDAVAFDVEALVDEGAVRAKGKAGLVGEPRVEGRVELERLAPRSFVASAPPLELDGAAEGQWSFAPGGGGRATARLSTKGGGGLPSASLEAEAEGTLEALDARAKLDAAGASLEANATLSGGEGGQVVRGKAKLTAGQLARLPTLGLGSGALWAEAQGSYEVASGEVSAEARVEARGVARGAERVDSLSVDASVSGAATSPKVGLKVRAAGLAAAGYRVGDGVAMNASLQVGEGVSVKGLRLSMRSPGGDDATLSAASIDAKGGRVDVRGVSFEAGASRLSADAQIAPGSVKVRSSCRDLDLAALARFVEPAPAVMGTVSCDVDAEAGPSGLRGEARVTFRDLDVPGADVFDGELDVAGQGRAVRLAARARSKHLGEVVVREAQIELGKGGALGPAAWKGATGAASLSANVPLPLSLAALKVQAPVSAGELSLSATVRRDDAKRLPSLSAEIATKGVAVDLPKGPLTGVDARAALRFDGDGRGAYVGVELYDKGGTLVKLEGSGEVPERALRGEGQVKELAFDTPFELSVDVPERRVRDLPLVGAYARGDDNKASLNLSFTGSLRRPALDLRACLSDVDPPDGGERFALNVASTYDGRLARVDAKVRSSHSDDVADASVSVEASAADLLARGGGAPWVASAEAHFHDAPLSALPPVAGRAFGGRLNGEIVVSDLRRDAKARGWLVAEGLSLGDAEYESASVEIDVGKGMARALAQLRQKEGGATLEAEVPTRWGAELAPTPDLMAGWRARATARSLRVALAGAFAPAAVTDIDGFVDADATFEAKNGGAPTGEARVALSKGRIYAVALGQGFHDVGARATLSRDGRINVEGLSARGRTGKITGEASGRVSASGDASVDGTLTIARGEPLPVTLEGESLGEASGTIGLSARVNRAAKRTELGVDIRSFYMRLSEASAHDLQTIDKHEDVRIGVRRPGGEFAAIPLTKPAPPEPPSPSSGPSTLRVTINFGNVLIVRGTDVRVGLGGRVAATMAEQMGLEGQIRLRQGGYFEVQGRRFRVENGTVSFSGGSASNAVVIATASWTAPDGTRVFADFAGPIGTGRLTLRSEPTHSPNEIVALLVFGTADSATAFQKKGGGSGTGGVPLSAGGAIAAKGLNNALYRMTKLDLQTRIDTSNGTVRPEVVVPLSASLSLEVSRVLGTPPPGQSPDRTFVSFEWRFRRRWSLETISGDKGRTGVDTFWTYSY